MKRCLIAVVLCFLLTAPLSFAQNQEEMATKEDIQQLFQVMNSRRNVEAMMAAVRQQMSAMRKDAPKKYCPKATPEQLAKIDEFFDKQLNKLLSNMPFDEMLEAMIPAYRRHFTHNEVKEIVAFYSSQIGKKVIAEIPAMMSEATADARPILQKWVETSTATMQADLERFMESLKNEKPATPCSDTSKS